MVTFTILLNFKLTQNDGFFFFPLSKSLDHFYNNTITNNIRINLKLLWTNKPPNRQRKTKKFDIYFFYSFFGDNGFSSVKYNNITCTASDIVLMIDSRIQENNHFTRSMDN